MRHISLVKNSFRTLYSCTITRFTFDCVWLCLEWCRELVVVRLLPMHIYASAARLLSSAYSFPLNFFNRSSSRMLSSSGTEGRSSGSFVLNFLPYNASAGDIPNVDCGVVLYANRYVRSSSFQFFPSP